VKAKLSLCLINEAPRYEGIRGNGGIDPQLSISALEGGEWSASGPVRFTHGERARGIRYVGSWVGPQRRSGRCGENINILPFSGLEFRSSSP
jgi:hypothetical protein